MLCAIEREPDNLSVSLLPTVRETFKKCKIRKKMNSFSLFESIHPGFDESYGDVTVVMSDAFFLILLHRRLLVQTLQDGMHRSSCMFQAR
jgi:hypothetical protein